MNERFEIRGVLEQSSEDVLYEALDQDTKQKVVLRRMMNKAEGELFLKKEYQELYLKRLGLLIEAQGTIIRKVIAGGVDKVDGATWVAYESLEGESFLTNPPFEGCSKEVREAAMEVLLHCLNVLHEADLLLGWVGFENLFWQPQGYWKVELCPRRMTLASLGGVKVSHRFVSKTIKEGNKGSRLSDLQGVAELFTILKKGVLDDQKVSLSSDWLRFLSWIKKNRTATASEALERFKSITTPNVLGSLSEVRRKTRAITSYVSSQERAGG